MIMTPTFKLIDYTQYYANLTDIILMDNFKFQKQYSFRTRNSSNLDCKSHYTSHEKINDGSLYQNIVTNIPGFKNCPINNIIT